MRKPILILAAAAALTLNAGAEWSDLTGQGAPEITADEWLNTGRYEPTTADLRGKVYLLELFATW